MDFNELITTIQSLPLSALFKGLILLIAGFSLAAFVRSLTKKLTSNIVNVHTTMLMMRFSYYLVLGIFLLTALHQFGFEINTLLGLAGFFTVALGFAAQTAASNLISGFFMLGEKPFQIGDLIRVDRFQGEVIAIDLLSTKLRKTDNTMIRIPNESLLKTSLVNLSRFPMRRFDMIIHVDTKTPLDVLQTLFFNIAKEQHQGHHLPMPEYYILGFEEHGVKVQCSIWLDTPVYFEQRSVFMMRFHKRIIAEGIQLAHPPSLRGYES